MKKSRINKIMGMLVCLALVLGTLPMHSFAELNLDGGGSVSDSGGGGELSLEQGNTNGGQQDPEQNGGGELTIEGSDDDSGEEEPSDDGLNLDAGAESGSEASSGESVDGVINPEATGGPLKTGIQVSAAELEDAGRLIVVTDVNPDQVESGAPAALSLVLTYNTQGAQTPMDPQNVQAIVKIPAGLEIEIIGNDLYEYDRAEDSQTGETTITMTLKSMPAGGSGSGFTPVNMYIPKGVTDHGKSYTVSVEWFYGGQELFDREAYTFTAQTKRFNWNILNSGADNSQFTLYGNDNQVGDIEITYAMNNNYAGNQAMTGRAYTKSVVLTDTIKISDKIWLTEDQISWEGEGSGEKRDVVKRPGTEYVDSFSFVFTKLNTGDGDMGNFSDVKLRLGNLLVDDAAVKAAMAPGDEAYTIPDAVSSGGLVAVATPQAALDPASAENKATDDLNGEKVQRITLNDAFSVRVTRDYTEEEPLTDAPSGRIVKSVREIRTVYGEVPADGRTSYVYPNESIVYEFSEFGNKRSTSMTSLKLVDTFDPEEMYPLEVTSGRYTTGNATTLRIYAGDEVIYQNQKTSLYSDYRWDLRNVAGMERATRIELDFGTVAPGFQPISSLYNPTATMRVVNSGRTNAGITDPEDQPKVVNQLDLVYVITENGRPVEYSYDKLEEKDKEEGNFRSTEKTTYYASPDENGGEGRKAWTVLRRSTPGAATIQKDDLLEYTLTFEISTRESGPGVYYDAKDPFVDDTYHGQVPYTQDTLGRLDSYAGDEADGFIQILMVMDKDGNDVTDQRKLSVDGFQLGAIPGTAWTDPVPANGWRIRLKSDDWRMGVTPHPGHLSHGDTVVISYVMRVTDPAALKNAFQSYSDPTGEGNPDRWRGSGGDTTIDPRDNVFVKPTITTTITAYDANGNRNLSTNPASKDDLITIKHTIKNDGPDNAVSVNLAGFIPLEYEASNGFEGFEFVFGSARAYYTRSSGQPREEITNLVESPRYTNGVQLARIKIGTSAAHVVELAPGQSVDLEYEVKVKSNITNWDNNDNAYQYTGPLDMLVEQAWEYTTDGEWDDKPGTSSHWSTDQDGRSKSYLFGGYANVYIVRTNYKVGLSMSASNVNRTIALNPDSNMNSVTGPTDINNQLNFYNYGSVLDVDYIVVRLPKYESMKDHALYDWGQVQARGPGNDDLEVVWIRPRNPLTILPGGSSTVFTFYTEVTDEAVRRAVSEGRITTANYLQASSRIEVAFYSEEAAGLIASSTSTTWADKIAPVDDAERAARWGGVNVFTGVFYKATSEYLRNYNYYGPAPGVSVQLLGEINDEYVAVSNTTPFNPKDKIAYAVTLSLQSDSSRYLSSLETPILAVQLPAGTALDTAQAGKLGLNYTTYTQDGLDYVIIQLNENLTTSAQKRIEIPAIVGQAYGTRAANFYLMSKQEFFAAHGVMTDPGKRIHKSEAPYPIDNLPGTAGTYEYVLHAIGTFQVTGRFAFETVKTVSVDGGAAGRTVDAGTREVQKLSYTLELKNMGTETAYNDVTLIERLPGAGDLYIMDPLPRKSTAAVSMTGAPKVYVDGALKTLGTDYKLSYTSAAANTVVTGKDLNLSEKDNLTPTITWTDAAGWPDVKTATMFRVELLIPLDQQQTLTVTFDGKPSGTMPDTGALAVNTFGAGFKATTGARTVEVYPETDDAKVTFPNVQVMVIRGTVFQDVGEINGIYDGGDLPFTAAGTRLSLYNTTNPNVPLKQAEPDSSGAYEFIVSEEGAYFVQIELPTGYEIFGQFLGSEPQGNKFYTATRRTDEMTYVHNQGETYIRNAAVVTQANGTLTLTKKLSGTGGAGIGNKTQKFVFRIDYKESEDPGAPVVRTFYEVIAGAGSRTITGLDRGVYIVTEVDWATGHVQEGQVVYGTSGNKIDYTVKDIQATATNTRDRKDFLHAIADKENKFTREG